MLEGNTKEIILTRLNEFCVFWFEVSVEWHYTGKCLRDYTLEDLDYHLNCVQMEMQLFNQRTGGGSIMVISRCEYTDRS